MNNEKEFLFTFLTPEKELINRQAVQEIICPSENGELNILPQHSPLIVCLMKGEVSYKIKNQWKKQTIKDGFLEVYSKGVRILAEIT